MKGAELGAGLSPSQGRRIVRQRLRQLSNSAFLSEAAVARLSRRLTARYYATGEPVMLEGVHGECMGLVARGQVAIYSSSSNHRNPTALLLPGSTFGEAMLTDGRPSSSTLRAVTGTEVHFLRRADFLAEAGQRQHQPSNMVERWLRCLVVVALALVVIDVLLLSSPARRALALVPYSTGLWLRQHDRADWAKTAWTLAQQLTPDWAAPHLSLGNHLFSRGQVDQAQAELEQALILTPDLAEALNSLGLLYAARNDQFAAIEAFQEALSLEPGQATVEGNLAFSLQLVGKREEALQHYALARLLDTPQPALLANEAIAHYEAGNLDAAATAARQALALDDTLAPAHTILGAVSLAQDHPQAAAISLEEAVYLDPAYSPAHFYLGLAYKSLNQPGLAIAAFEHALTLTADPVAQREARRHLSELYARYGTDTSRYQIYLVGERR